MGNRIPTPSVEKPHGIKRRNACNKFLFLGKLIYAKNDECPRRCSFGIRPIGIRLCHQSFDDRDAFSLKRPFYFTVISS